MQQHLSIAFSEEAVADGLELVPELTVVVDLAVEYEVQPPVVERLIRTGVEVDDREAPERQAGDSVCPDALIVGPPVSHCARHPGEHVQLGGR